MSIEYRKVKSAAKHIEYKGPKLNKIILETLKNISSIVGSTLGPGGNPVLVERYEHDIPPTVTKDGVTVFRSLGMRDPVAQVILETTRDSAVKTASEAGDGTTTATILMASIVEAVQNYCNENPTVSPQKVMRHLDKVFKDVIEPTILKLSTPVKFDEEGKERLKSVARLSANGDEDLARAVMECFDIAGDDGNVTIETYLGNSRNEVEEIKGFPIAVGYEKSCFQFWPQFINDGAFQRCVLENPAFLLYNGRLTEIQSVGLIMQSVGRAASQEGSDAFTKNVVIVAHGFSDSFVGSLAAAFPRMDTLNIFPLVTPETIQQGSQNEFLKDLAAITGATVFDPLTNPLNNAKLGDLGSGIELFEANRYRSNVIGMSDEDKLLIRQDEVRIQLNNSISELDQILNKERLAKLLGGIAKLKIYGSSNGETKERRDRAEDAICAVRGALKHGYLPGGCWTLLKVRNELLKLNDIIVVNTLVNAFLEPFTRLIKNCGIDLSETDAIYIPIDNSITAGAPIAVYDFLEQKIVDPYQAGILDSTPAVLEAIRNALSIALRVGTLGGVVVQYRDEDYERSESKSTSDFLKMAEENPADNRY